MTGRASDERLRAMARAISRADARGETFEVRRRSGLWEAEEVGTDLWMRSYRLQGGDRLRFQGFLNEIEGVADGV